MKRIRDKVAGLDVHRDSVVAGTRIVEPDRSVSVAKASFSTMAKGLAELAAWLRDAGVETVGMEATGVYWKPVFYELEGLFDEVWLCNAAHVKNVPGRKSDLSDAEWLADVVAHGMVKPSLRAPERDPRGPRADALSKDPGRHPGQGDPAPREDPPRRRHQAHVGGLVGVARLDQTHDRGADRGRA